MPGNNYKQHRKHIAGLLLLIFIACCPLRLLASADIEYYNSLAEKAQTKAQIIWKRSGAGKTADILFLPNHTIILPLSDKVLCIDEQGLVKWESKSQGKGGIPVWLGGTSIFAPGMGSVQEIKLNGASGWNIAVVPATKGLKTPMLAGYTDLVYLPATEGLYALKTDGKIAWIMSPWESTDNYKLKTPAGRSFLTCAADSNTFYLIKTDEKGKYQLKAISSQGTNLWSFWLGDVLSAWLYPDGQGKVYLTTTIKPNQSGSKKNSKLNNGYIYCFERDGKRPLWQTNIKIANTLSQPVFSTDGTLYCTTTDHLFAINSVNGQLIWDNVFPALTSPPGVDDQKDRIYVGTSEENLLAISKQGSYIWTRKLEGAIEMRPYPNDGYIYVQTKKGNLFKIKDVFDK